MKTHKALLKLLLVLLVLLAATGARSQVREQPGAARLVAIRAARLLDVRSGDLIDNAVILVEGDRVKAVGQHIAIPPGARVIDLGNVTLLPGLIDCHTHVLLEPEDERGHREHEDGQGRCNGIAAVREGVVERCRHHLRLA